MITENLSTLKIHNLTKEQYERELAAGRIDENALYLTPHEETDLNEYVTRKYVDEVLEGKANASHGEHVTFSSTAPAVAGTASAGSASTVSRSDHVHPAQTSVTGNAGSATKWAKSININGMSINGEDNRFNYGTCSTSASTAAKTVSCAGFTLATGAEITVKFTVNNTASRPTLNVNSTGAKSIYYRGSAITANYLAANRTYTFRYNGTQYDLVGDISEQTEDAGSIDIDLDGSNSGNANTINADTLGGILHSEYATKTYTNTQIKKAAPKNLLDNSDFRNPVNQRGQTSYKGISNGNLYTIDRWFLGWQGNTTVTVGDGYIQKNEGKYSQLLENIDLNKIYTGALCLADGTLYVYSGTFSSGFGEWDRTICVRCDSNGSCYFRIEKDMTQPMIWAALYEGEYTVDTLPEYQPKGYAVELLECKRYFEKIEVFNPLSEPNYGETCVSMGITYAEKRIPICTYTIDLIWCPGWYGPEQLGTITFENSSERSIQINVSNIQAAGKIAQVKMFISADL